TPDLPGEEGTTPDLPGDSGEAGEPETPGTGGTTPDLPGEEGTTPDLPGDSGEAGKPETPGTGGTTPDLQGEEETTPDLPGDNGEAGKPETSVMTNQEESGETTNSSEVERLPKTGYEGTLPYMGAIMTSLGGVLVLKKKKRK
ncbi:LPXTG cell wall anchor domain-containing protein, partial [Clostridium sardiniense]|uniref:LPXTG cell wall anchor domain-containing protein n=1 Tax=Clostridium sardiniense TaxID=29369 RepID=UPI00195A5CDE